MDPIIMENTTNQKINNDNKDKTIPDDLAGYYIRGFVKIFDPESGVVIVEKSE
jgi:hypothetical protein